MTSYATVDELLDGLWRGEGFDDGEDVDVLAHMLQTAALLADVAPNDLELQAAGLVHDVGWLLDATAPEHGDTGATAVNGLLGARVAALVAGHDRAKRYLVTTDPDYRAVLSGTSVATLALQGGDMTDDEIREFEADEHFESLVTLRRADDAAKVPGRSVPDLDTWRSPLELLATR